MTNQTESKLREGGLRRREAFVLLGGAGITGLLAGCGDDDAVSSVAGQRSDSGAASSCVLTPEVTEGPYWIDNNLTRRDIREGKGGLPLAIVFTVQNARTCDPIPRADVEIWHCDALGEYSGFDTGSGGGPGAPPPPGGGGQEPSSTTRYLRGHQKANAKGQARFLTVFPGWYAGRTPHIHLKVHVGGDVVHTGQVFFADRIAAEVYRRAPYRSHGQPEMTNAQDSIYAQAGKSRARLKLRRRGASKPGYRGTITLGVAA